MVVGKLLRERVAVGVVMAKGLFKEEKGMVAGVERQIVVRVKLTVGQEDTGGVVGAGDCEGEGG